MHRLPLLLVPVLLGCLMPPNDGSEASQEVTVDLTARKLDSTPDEDFARAVAAADHVKLEGAITTPTPCYDLVPRVRREGAAVTVAVEARAKEGGCIQVISAFGYDGAVRGLPPGRYTLRVLHAYPGTGWDGRTALEAEIEVP